jgi:NADH-quinone oxidoreductase subunit L
MWIGSLAIIGFPFFSGYYSKESILENAYFATSGMAQYAYVVGVFTALLTAFYSWRLLLMTFHGNPHSTEEIFNQVHESPKVMTISLAILAIGTIFSGSILANFFIGSKQEVFWNHALVLIHTTHYNIPFVQTLIIKSTVAAGILLAAMLYFYKKDLKKSLSRNFQPLYSISYNKWYVDELYNSIFIQPFFYIASIFWKKGDIYIIDEYGPNGISKLINYFARRLSLFQSGYLYHYAFVMLGGLVIILTWFVYY